MVFWSNVRKTNMNTPTQKQLKTRERQRRYRQRHKEELAKKKKEFYEANKERIAIDAKRYYQKHEENLSEEGIEKRKERQKQNRQRNKKKIIERAKKHYEENKEKIGEAKHKRWHESIKPRIESDLRLFFKQRMKDSIKKRKKKHECTITINDLVELYEKQNGRCAITNIEMTTIFNTHTTISVDRIESSVGYIPGNIQLVCVAINLAKHHLSQESIIEFVEMIKNQGRTLSKAII